MILAMLPPLATGGRAVSREEVFRQVQSEFAQSEPALWWKIPLVIFLLTVAMLLLVFLSRLQRRRLQDQSGPQPLWLYLRTLLRLGLPCLVMWRLWRLARVLDIDHPTALLISPVLYDEAVVRFCSLKRLSAHAGAVRQLADIRRRLFEPQFPNDPIRSS